MIAPDLAAASMRAVVAHVAERLAAGEACPWIRVVDPERHRHRHSGEVCDGVRHRPWRVWVELADRLGVRLRVAPSDDGRIAVGFEVLAPEATPAGPITERYGADAAFARIDKAEEPGFLLDFTDALERAALPPAPRILELGVHTGWALALATELMPARRPTLVGVDHSASALAVARARLPDATLIEADLAALPALDLGRFDLVLAIGVLQSPGVDDRALLRHIVQARLNPGGAFILGVPNCRYRDGVLVPGARVRNFRQPELGLVVKDLAFYRKYLQQHDREVWITGQHYLFVTAARRR